jgi:hypothetical protein
MKNPMDDDRYTSNDEQIQDLKDGLLAALTMVRRLEEHLDYTGWGDSWERECARPLMRDLELFTLDWEGVQ